MLIDILVYFGWLEHFSRRAQEVTMAAFFAKTWFLWYAFAVVIIMRWFHVAGWDAEADV